MAHIFIGDEQMVFENLEDHPPSVLQQSKSLWIELGLQFKETHVAIKLSQQIESDLEELTEKWNCYSTKGSFQKSLGR